MSSPASSVSPTSSSPLASIDPAAYTRVPPLDLPSMIALCRQLLVESPTSPPPAVRSSQGQLAMLTQHAADEHRAQLGADRSQATRPIDIAADNAWGCTYRRLATYADLPADLYPRAGRAQALLARLFPDGLRFTQLEYGAQWVEAESRIQILIADRGRLRTELTELVGDDFVEELFRAHAAYGEMVGATRRRPLRARTDLRSLRLRLMEAATTHLIQLVATYLNHSTSARTRSEIERCFATVDLYRDKLSSPRREDEPAPPEPPAPPAPPAPPVLGPALPAPTPAVS